jgi:glycosyltransferase involved in cell wall biosynthesis
MTWLVLASSENATYGYGTLSRGLLEAFRSDGKIEFDVLSGEKPKRRFGLRWKLKSLSIGSRPRLWPLYVGFDFLCLIITANKKYQGVLVLVEQYAAAAWIFGKVKNIPLVVVQCGTYAVRLPKDIPLFAKVAASADRLIPISGYTHSRMLQENIKGRYSVIPLGVDTKLFRPVEGQARRNDVLFVGNLKARKGIDFLVEALAISKLSVPDLRLVVIGKVNRESNEFRLLSEKTNRLGLDVKFSGFLDHSALLCEYSAARLNALPSKSDPYFFEG